MADMCYANKSILLLVLHSFCFHVILCSFGVCSLFNDTFFSNSDYITSSGWVISEWCIGNNLEGSGRGLVLRYSTGICLED
jgi:hypothetical protein